MARTLIAFVFCCFLTTTTYAQIPEKAQQAWWEYPINASLLHEPGVRIPGNSVSPDLPEIATPSVIDLIKRETGEEAWTGKNLGFIGMDEQKLYVFHTPEIQKKVGEVVGRLLRPETRFLKFESSVSFITVPTDFPERLGSGFVEADQTVAETGYSVERFYRCLDPILGPDRKPICKSSHVRAYRISRDDLPKFQEQLHYIFSAVQGDTLSNQLSAPKVVAFNGQAGIVMDLAHSPFATDFVRDKDGYKPVFTVCREGQLVSSFSLLSWDGKTVTTDLSALFGKIRAVKSVDIVPGDEKTRVTAQIPEYQEVAFSEKGLVWPADGMLFIVIEGPKVMAERATEAGSPFLSKLPFINRRFSSTAIARVEMQIYGLVTVRMLDEGQGQAQNRQTGQIGVR